MGLGAWNVIGDNALIKSVLVGFSHKAKCDSRFILIIQDHIVFRCQRLGSLEAIYSSIAKVLYNAPHEDDLLSKPIGLFDGASHGIKGTAACECNLEKIVLEVVLETS